MEGAGDTIRVLHVDDEREFVDGVGESLEREDPRFEVRTATSARAGLDRLSETDVDCVVSAYDVGDQTGIELLATLREDHPDLPFVLYTGRGSEEVASEAISAGVTDYLQKESGTDQYAVLANRILNAVESYRSRQTLTERNRTLRKYERMVNTMQEAACIYDADGRFEIVNEYLADWYGTTREDLEGTRSTLITHVRAQGETDRYEELLAGDRREIQGELAREFPGRGHAVIEYHLTPLTADGTADAAVGVARDITAHREREQELRRQNERLEEFASVVSHDLRNPLQLAGTRLELAREDCESTHLASIEDALDRMERIVEDVLALAREGEPVDELDRVDLAATAESCWRNVRTADATLVTDDDPTIRADRSRLKRVFENLVRNSIEHAGTDVTLTVGALEDGFYVEDDGPGIPPDGRDEVFEAGYSTADEGTGFGLNIVEQIVTAHGWEITATEGSAGGARFEITGVEFATG